MWSFLRGKELRSYFDAGYFSEQKGNIPLAIENYAKALKLAEELNDKEKETDACICVGRAFFLIFIDQTAIYYYEKALEIAKERGDKGRETGAYLDLGDIYRLKNQYQRAIEYYEKVLELAKEQDDKGRETSAYLDLGDAYGLNNQYQRAIEFYEEALKLATEQRDKGRETEACGGLGDAYRFNNQYHRAIEYYEKVLDIAKVQGDKGRQTGAYLDLGDAYGSNHQYQRAIEFYEKALELAKDQHDRGQETEAYGGLGDAYRFNNQYERAIEYYEKSLEFAKRQDDKGRETGAYLNLGYAYRSNNQYQRAIECYEKALELAKEQGDQKRVTGAYDALGDAYGFISQYQRAIEYYEKVLELAKKQGDKGQETGAYRDLGYAYRSNSQYQRAIEYYEKALEIAKERSDKRQETEAYLGLGHAYKSTNQFPTVIEYFELPLEIAKEEGDKQQEIKLYLKLCDSYGFLKQNRTAKEYWEKAFQLAEKEGFEALRKEILDIKDNYAQALFNEKNESANEKGPMSAEQLLNLGISYEGKGENENAIKRYEQVVQTADETDQNDIKAKACQHLGNVCTRAAEYKKAIKYYQKAREISPSLEANELEVTAYEWLGYNHYHAGQFKESIEYYKELVTLSTQLGNEMIKFNAYLGLGCAFSNAGDFESSQSCFLKALTAAEQLNDERFQKKAHANLGFVYHKSCKFDSAVKSYLEARKFSDGLEDINVELNSHLILGNCLCNTGDHEQAMKYLQATKIATALNDRHSEGKISLEFAWVCMKDCNYEMAVECYQKAVDIFGTELDDHLLEEKALTGLAVACLSRGDHKKAMECIQKAQTIVEKGTKTDSSSNEEKNPDIFFVVEESEPVTNEWVESFIEEACNPSRTEQIASEEFVRIKKYVEYISYSYVYTRRISSEKPFTDKVRKAMTEDVKTSAHNYLLYRNNDEKRASHARKVVNEDEQVFYFAKDEVSENASTKKLTRLNERLALCTNSVGQIACGNVRGTCFLVTDVLVITNYHVYRMMKDERSKLSNLNLPITVSFDYLYSGQTENILTVEVDEEQDASLENPYLDYKFFRLKENIGRIPLGPLVRDFQLADRRVVIVGHPEGKEMQVEVCSVVGYSACLERQRNRNEQFTGIHMTNRERQDKSEDYEGFLSYDTSFFSGSCGSPVFDMDGNIVAIHTQGYLLEREENVSNDENERDSNQVQENRRRISRKYCLMEFGAQFFLIYRDIRRLHGQNVVKEIFPHYDEIPSDQRHEARPPNEKSKETAHLKATKIGDNFSDDEEAKKYFYKAVDIFGTKLDDQNQAVATFNLEEKEQIGSAEKPVTAFQKETGTVNVVDGKDDKRTFLEKYFLDDEYNIKEEVHEKFKRFTWLCGEYGVTRPNKKIPYPHFYVTVKRRKKKSDVLQEIEEVFNSEAKHYFELRREPKKEPKFSYLCGTRPSPGGGIVAQINPNTPSPLRITEGEEVEESDTLQATGTITMFCSLNGDHYALTCCHVGCVIFDERPNAPFNLCEVLKIRQCIDGYKARARNEIEYYYCRRRSDNLDNNENINPVSHNRLGEFTRAEFHSKADIMSIKVHKDAEIDCTMAEVDFPDWGQIGKELFDRIDGHSENGDEVTVEKVGYSTNFTSGHIVKYNYNYDYLKKPLFQDAIVVKGNSRTFLKSADSGALIFFFDKNKQKQAFAYGVCEVDDISHTDQSSDEDSEDTGNSSISSSDSAEQNYSESDDEELSASTQLTASEEFEGASTSRVCETEDGNEEDSSDESIEGPFFICLKLNVALRDLELRGAGCFRQCGAPSNTRNAR